MAKKKKSKDILKRGWLNKKGHHSTAIYYFEASALDELHPFIHLSLSDCSRMVELDFSVSTNSYHSSTVGPDLKTFEESLANSRFKVSQIRAALDKVDAALDVAEQEVPKEIKATLKRRKKREKREKKN